MKKALLIVTLTLFLGALIAVTPQPAKSNPDGTEIYVYLPGGNCYPGVPANQFVYVYIGVKIPAAWDDTAHGLTGWAFSVDVDPTVLEPMGVTKPGDPDFQGGTSYLERFLYRYGYIWSGYSTSLLTGGVYKTNGTIWDISEQIMGWGTLMKGAGGNSEDTDSSGFLYYWIARVVFRSKSQTAYSVIHLRGGGGDPNGKPYFFNTTGGGVFYSFDTCTDGCYGVPEFPLGAAVEIGFTVAVAYILLRRRKTKPTVAKRFTTQTLSQ